ncbi:16S rRNA (cytidine(1402)-2'-O)-methyltransferase [Oikeobacillus pervagus]|uniref:16S rRNA (cytidine(1402)-2'-O)-methyltransferase n=1 Tax=Oikeobacillus pervagus TaxID=1325931 RepID=UPI0027D86934|nr:16S rRNA (cytidine(1402)-2'-O)-methyltransferase [Oikeobacillus pervagus]
MHHQKSFVQDEFNGAVYLVPTPIGNLEDMTFRAVRVLKEVQVIAAEDTRNTKKLCHYFEISTPIISYHEHNKEASGRNIIERLKKGEKVALVSDAGMPAISDPGYELVLQAIEEEIPVIPLPGANAALTALIASGIQTQPFLFFGFLDRQKKAKKQQLLLLKKYKDTVILYESPHRLKETLECALDVLGNRKIVLCRELTKKFEEFLRGNIQEALEWAKNEKILGEFCLIIEGSREEFEEGDASAWWSDFTIVDHVNFYIQEKQLHSKEAIKQTAKDRGLPKREVYQEYHVR